MIEPNLLAPGYILQASSIFYIMVGPRRNDNPSEDLAQFQDPGPGCQDSKGIDPGAPRLYDEGL